MKKTTIIVISCAVGAIIIAGGIKIIKPNYERSVFEKARKSIETDIPNYANEALCANEWVTNVNVITDFTYEYKYDTYYDYTDNIKYEIVVENSFDSLNELEQYDILKGLDQTARSIYDTLSHSDDAKYKAYNIKAYDYSLYCYTSIDHDDDIFIVTDTNTYQCSEYSESYTKNDTNIDIGTLRKEYAFSQDYTEITSQSPWIGEWENPSFSEKTITKVYSKDDTLYLCLFKGDKTLPFSIVNFPDSSNCVPDFNEYGDLTLQSDNELLFPAHNDTYDLNGVYKFVRVGCNIDAPRELIVSKENRKEPAIGMTADEVKLSKWGEPGKINTTTTQYGTSEQWVYSKGYIYLENGIVTAIQKME